MTRSRARIGLVACVFFAAQAAAATPADLEARVGEYVRAEMVKEKVPGIAVGIFSNGETVLAAGYGESNVEHRVPVSSETMFQSASVGKQFTAVAVMLQVDDGKVALDDSIKKYFPDAPESWRPVTVRHLLNHTSGIQDYFEGVWNGGPGIFDTRRDYTEEEMLAAFYKLPIESQAGARWHYCNTGYVLLGYLVRRVSGKFYGDVLEERVFAPLGMKTARVISEADVVPNRASGYQLVDGQLKNQEWYAPTVNTTADGALHLSVADLAAWDRGLRSGALLTKQSWEQVYTPAKLGSAKAYPYGFGWFIGESNGGPWYYHSGSSQGFTTYISRYRARDLTIVVLTNLIDAEPARFVDGIAAIVDPTLAQLKDRKQ